MDYYGGRNSREGGYSYNMTDDQTGYHGNKPGYHGNNPGYQGDYDRRGYPSNHGYTKYDQSTSHGYPGLSHISGDVSYEQDGYHGESGYHGNRPGYDNPGYRDEGDGSTAAVLRAPAYTEPGHGPGTTVPSTGYNPGTPISAGPRPGTLVFSPAGPRPGTLAYKRMSRRQSSRDPEPGTSSYRGGGDMARSASVRPGLARLTSVRQAALDAGISEGDIDQRRRELLKEIAEKESNELNDEEDATTTCKKVLCCQTLECKRRKGRIADAFSVFEIWRVSLKDIEGFAGPSTLSYFRFVKYLFLFNVVSMLVILGTIILPQAFMDPNDFASSLENQFGNQTLNKEEERALSCSEIYAANVTARVESQGVVASILDFFQGTGWMENTYVFMGFYFNKTYMFEDYRAHYNMPLAFLFSLVGYMVLCLIVMVRLSARGFKDQVVHSDQTDRYFNNVFCAWDFGLSSEKGAERKKVHIYRELTHDLEEDMRRENKEAMKTSEKAKLYTVRILINLLVLGILFGAGALIYMVLAVWMNDLLAMETVQSTPMLELLVEYLPSITLTFLNALVPILFLKLVIPEKYSPEFEIKITIARTVFLRLATVAMYTITIIIRIMGCGREDMRTTCGCEPILCWETFLGQQFFKLVITDMIVVMAMVIFMDFPRSFLVRKLPNTKCFQLWGAPEFDIVIEVLDIVYAQAITWIGGFFCPIIPCIAVVRFFCTFYLKKLSLFKCCVPQPRQNKASQTAHFFMIILLVSFALCAVALVYTAARMPPSTSCGPFRIHTSSEFYMYTAVPDAISTLPYALRQLFNVIGSRFFTLFLIFFFSLVVYYYRVVISANKNLTELLQHNLAQESKDKQFILRQVNDTLQKQVPKSATG